MRTIAIALLLGRLGRERNRRRAVALAAAALVASGCGSSSHPAARRSPPATHVTPPPPPRRPTVARAAGSLPQTRALPGAPRLDALWRGVTSGSPRVALPDFFPERAYLQVKAIADARADYSDRLVHGYALDVAAAHALVGSHAQLVRIAVPGTLAHWVAPGACFNRVGYWEVPGARVVYRRAGALRSFAIASLISWRGVWYVVHLGGVMRSGVVDDPEVGANGQSPATTC